MNILVEELKQRITAIAAKIRRYQGQVVIKGSFIGNYIRKKKNVIMISLWLKNQNSFGETYGVSLPTIRRMQNGYKTCEVKLMLKNRRRHITTGSLKKILGRMPNWKSPGPDVVQGFCLKGFSTLHERVRLQLKQCLDCGFLPRLTRGRTSLLQKDKSKGNVASNYRPITCLPLMWKLLTGVIADQIYAHLDQEKLLPEEQKGFRKGSRETNDFLYIDRALIKEVKSRNKNLAMAWIDYKKVYDMVPHLWIIECLDLFGVAETIKSLLVNSMEKWKVMLCSGNSELGEVKIKHGIFQGNSLSPLVFVLALILLSQKGEGSINR